MRFRRVSVGEILAKKAIGTGDPDTSTDSLVFLLLYKCKRPGGARSHLTIGILCACLASRKPSIRGALGTPGIGVPIVLRLARGCPNGARTEPEWSPTDPRKRHPLGAGKHAAELG